MGSASALGRVAVVIPCHDEGRTIADVVTAFRGCLPDAEIVVADNASTDDTAARAVAAGARVIRETRKGKGFAVSRLFADVDADCYLMVDGDMTYDASVAPEMCRRILEEGLDMVCGVRIVDSESQSGREYRPGHEFGNRFFSASFGKLFGLPMADVFTGYRAMSRRFVRSYLGVAKGFEIEIELNAHCYAVSAGYGEVPGRYRDRPADSTSKLRTYRDGALIAQALLRLFRDLRPLAAFSALALPCAVVAVALGLLALIPYLQTGVVLRFPSLIASLALAQAAIILVSIGLVLSQVTLNRREARRLAYLARSTPSTPALDGDTGRIVIRDG